MELRPLVEQYLKLAGEFGRPVALERFELPRGELERLFSAWDEDYHLSRFLHLSREAGPAAGGAGAAEFIINGFPYTHVAFEIGVLKVI